MATRSVDWWLVDAELGHDAGLARACLRIDKAKESDSAEISLSVLPSGRIHELVSVEKRASLLGLSCTNGRPLKPVSFEFRRVGLFERNWRMANRVFDCFRRLTRTNRLEVGLTLWKAVSDLPGAYRVVTMFRRRLDYSTWVTQIDCLNARDKDSIIEHIARFPMRPHFKIVVYDAERRGELRLTLSALDQQLYRDFDCTVLEARAPAQLGSDDDLPLWPDNSRLSSVSQHNRANWLVQLNTSLADESANVGLMFIKAGDVLAPHALYWFAHALNSNPRAAVFFADDDKRNAKGHRCEPRFKPDWSLVHFRSTNFIGNAVALRGGAVAAAGGVTFDCCLRGSYDLLLRACDALREEADMPVHIPAILLTAGTTLRDEALAFSRQETTDNVGDSRQGLDADWEIDALQRHLRSNDVVAEVKTTLHGCRQVKYCLPRQAPLVSIIIPTRDAFALITRCVNSLLDKTIYPTIEILIVDNQSAEPEVLSFFAEVIAQSSARATVRLLRYDHPFNYSAINNFAVSEAKGEVICLLNNDTEVISPDWLDEMVGLLLQPRVGVVGAKLYFPDGRVQHAGDTVGPGGCANHLHAFLARDDPGYCNRAAVAQELSAVTAACLVTWRELYLRLGGLDEKLLKIAFNDVDYCLRVRQSGHKVVWTPHAELYHHESVSRGKDTSWRQKLRAEKEVMVMRRRWKHLMQNDPFYNPNLSYMRPDFSLSHVLRVRKPWQD